MGAREWAKRGGRDAKEAAKELWSFLRHLDWKHTLRNSLRRKYWIWWFVTLLFLLILGVLSLFRSALIAALAPYRDTLVALPASWLIPIAALVVASFPPLGGHKVVLLVVGMMWGFKEGMAVAAAGVLLGELLCFLAFKHLLLNRALALEDKSVFYGCLARLVREGGLETATIMRYSLVPGRVVTAVQSLADMSLPVFMLSIFLALPKQFAFVYLGVAYGDVDPEKIARQSIVSIVVLAATGLATVLSFFIVLVRVHRLYPDLAATAPPTEPAVAATLSRSSRPRPLSQRLPRPRPSSLSSSSSGEEAARLPHAPPADLPLLPPTRLGNEAFLSFPPPPPPPFWREQIERWRREEEEAGMPL